MDSVKIFLLIIGNILNIILSLFFFYLIRIIFDIEIVGYYGAILSFFTAFSLINDLGIQLAYLKFFGEAKNSEEEAIYNGTFLTFRTIQFISYIIMLLIFIPLAPTYNGEILVIFIFFIAMVFFRIDFFEPVFLSRKEAFKISLTTLLLIVLKDLLLILFVNFFNSDIWLLMNIILVSSISYFFLSLYLIRKKKFKKPDKNYLKRFLKFSLPFFFTNSLIFIVSNVDMLLLNMWSDINNVANYFTAKQFFYYFLYITNSISNILITTFSKNISNGKGHENLKAINQTHKIINLIILPIVFLSLLYAPSLFVLIFSEEYHLAGSLLFIFTLLLVPLSLDFANTVQLQALGEVHFIAKISILENLISILLMFFFISPNFLNLGVFGGAFAYLSSKVIVQLIYRPLIYKRFNLGFYWGSFRNMIIMLGVFLLQVWINSFFYYPIYLIPLFIIFDIALYVSLNYLFRGISKDDIKFILSVINIKKIYKSVFSEFKESTKN